MTEPLDCQSRLYIDLTARASYLHHQRGEVALRHICQTGAQEDAALGHEVGHVREGDLRV